ncbi:septum site-determining protein MinC [Legionella cardiaca]|uniref:Probable septum site-determining protein MinC n=1 Tax=Legionella cardiaca TaxID=1071983 RepID=A0ABY8AVZ8_9GAMM|nr:septum site-determining protein MinC [Legionella cardiaca]WED44653.1 septum site-determining protein MinC [Legionella cardiaca]
MVDNILKSQAFKLKGRLYTFTVLQLLSRDCLLFKQQLIEIIAKAPRLFDKTPVVLDCSVLEDGEIDLQAFCQCLREHHLLPVAIQGANPLLSTLAQCQGLAVLNASSTHDKPLLEEFSQEAAPAEPIKTKLLTTPVRSGQQVVSKGSDLIITASVSHGAELLADGNIHVYGALRGRALAGISGDTSARIFCHSLEAELVSIAGFYRLSDAIEPQTGPCQIYLQDEHIHIEPLC